MERKNEIKKVSYTANKVDNLFNYTIEYRDNTVKSETIELKKGDDFNPVVMDIINFIREVRQKAEVKNNVANMNKFNMMKEEEIRDKAYSEVVDKLVNNENKDQILDYLYNTYKNILPNSIMVNLYLKAEENVKNNKNFQKEPPKQQKSKDEDTTKENKDVVRNLMDDLSNELRDLVKKDLNDDELDIQLDKISRKYDVSRKSVGILYNKELAIIVNKRINDSYNNQNKENEQMDENLIEKFNSINKSKKYNQSKKELFDAAKPYVIPERFAEWGDMVYNGHQEQVPLVEAINVMKMAEDGKSMKEIRTYIGNIHNADINAKKVVELVSKFSPYGKQVEKGCRKFTMSKPERLKAFVLDKTAVFTPIRKKISDIIQLKDMRDELKKYSMQNEDEKGKAL